MITIRVFRRVGDAPAVGEKVTVSTGDGQRSGMTDSRGSVDFDMPGGREYTVFVRGSQVYRGPVAGVQTVYL